MIRTYLFRIRRRVVAVATLAIIAMQWTIAVHACTIGVPAIGTTDRAAFVSNDSATMPDCDEAGVKPAPGGKICAVHCQSDGQVDLGAVNPDPPLAPPVALSVSAVVPVITRLATTSALFAFIAAPPPRVLFSRFLI
jgi:hypothetical protein